MLRSLIFMTQYTATALSVSMYAQKLDLYDAVHCHCAASMYTQKLDLYDTVHCHCAVSMYTQKLDL